MSLNEIECTIIFPLHILFSLRFQGKFLLINNRTALPLFSIIRSVCIKLGLPVPQKYVWNYDNKITIKTILSDTASHSIRNALTKETYNENADEGGEKLEPSYTAGWK